MTTRITPNDILPRVDGRRWRRGPARWLAALWLGMALAGGATAVHAAETTTYVLTDVQGTVIMTEDAHGVTTSQQDYRPYGQPNGSVGPDGPGYTGHVNDPGTGLVYMQQRYYDPEVGRFLSVDPIEAGAGARYAYVSDNPIGRIDPDGREDRSSSDHCKTIECKKSRDQRRKQESDAPYVSGVPARRACVLSGGGCRFRVKDNPKANGAAPWYEIGWLGRQNVAGNQQYVALASMATGVDAKLIDAIIYMEASHGYYDGPLALINANKSILPMNVYGGWWGGAYGSREELEVRSTNILRGAELLRDISANLPAGSPVSHIATLYNNLGAGSVTDYGARVQQIYISEPWK